MTVKSIVSAILTDFVEINDRIFAKCTASRTALLKHQRNTNREWAGLDRTSVEAFENHLHVLDVLPPDPKLWDERRQRYRTGRPAFVLAESLGKAIAYAWFARLQREFPQYRFRVYYTRDDNPVVRFHRVYREEPVWLDEHDRQQDILDGRVLVLDTKRVGFAKRLALVAEGKRATRFLKGRRVSVVRRHRGAEVLVEFNDGWRLFVDGPGDLELSITEGRSSD